MKKTLARVATIAVTAGATVLAVASAAYAITGKTASDLRLKRSIRVAGAPLPPTV